MVFDFDDFHEMNHRLDLLHALHDANPAFRCTLFAIPARGSTEFWDATPEWCELAVHGWEHPHPREAEDWSYAWSIAVMNGAQQLSRRFVSGFKAPGWQISDNTYRAIMDRGWWVADHPENEARRPEGILSHVVGGPDHWHGHVQNDCGNGLEETWDELLERVHTAENFQWISEVVTPWRAQVAA